MAPRRVRGAACGGARASSAAALATAMLAFACRSAPPVPRGGASASIVAPAAGDPTAWRGEIARVCARAASCAHPHDPPPLADPSTCVEDWIARLPAVDDALHACLRAARTCDDVDACTHGRGDARAAAYCGAHVGLLTGCDGDRLVTCAGDDLAESTAVDCAALRARCGEESVPGGLVVRGCFSASLCPRGAPIARCDGARAIVTCHDGAVDRATCAEGTRCEEHAEADGERGASCEPPSAERCADPGARYCAGERLVACEARGHFGGVRAIDCAALGLRCGAHGAEAACVAPRPTCEPGPARCDGEALAFCAAGARVRVSCAEIGMRACDPDARGARAACAR